MMTTLKNIDNTAVQDRLLPLKALERKTYLSFSLEKEIFAVDVQHVHEVLDFTTTTKIPGAPDFMRGIINLRGRAVPVVDMRLKFGMGKIEKSVSTCIIVIEVGTGSQRTVIGALADAVQEVFEFDPGQIEPPPRLGEKGKMDFILAIGKRNDQFIIILNFNKAFSMEEVVLLGSAGEIPLEEDEMAAGGESGERQREE
jgi:purine-binding chemotaxis protein CheW